MAARLCCPAPRKPVDIDMYLVEWRQHLANDMDSGKKQSGSKSGGGGSTSKGSGKGSKKKSGSSSKQNKKKDNSGDASGGASGSTAGGPDASGLSPPDFFSFNKPDDPFSLP